MPMLKSLAALLLLMPAFHAHASFCSVYFDSEPQGARIYVAGSFIGTTPMNHAVGSAALLQVRIVKKGFREWQGEVHVPHNGVASFNRKLEPLSRRGGRSTAGKQ